MAVTPTLPDPGPVPRAPSRPAKTVPGEPITPVVGSAGVARLLSMRVGPPWYLGTAYFLMRVLVGFVLSAASASALGWLREAHGPELARSLSITSDGALLELVFAVGFLLSSVVVGYLVFGLTSRRWRRPKWGRP